MFPAARICFDPDVLDPDLAQLQTLLGAGTPSPQQSSAAIASVIEMGLINSTHVLAVMTENTRGSQWVPYEYGRVKEPAPITLQAACWADSKLAQASLPEYLYLGKMTRDEPELQRAMRSCLWWRNLGRKKGGAMIERFNGVVLVPINMAAEITGMTEAAIQALIDAGEVSSQMNGDLPVREVAFHQGLNLKCLGAMGGRFK